MRYFLISIITFFIGITSYSQNISGLYSSNSTSYKDDLNSEANYKIKGNYDVAIDMDNKLVMVHLNDKDKQLWVYKLLELDKSFEIEGKTYTIYKAKTEHYVENVELQIIFYSNKDKDLNLMIKAKDDSQVFFDLEKI